MIVSVIRQMLPRLVIAIGLLFFLVGCSSSDNAPKKLGEEMDSESTDSATGAENLGSYSPPHQKPGPAVDKILFNSYHVDRAPLHIQSGDMDLYLYSLKAAAAGELKKKNEIRLIEAPATTISLILNPAPAPSGHLNPFSNKVIRQAVRYLVDRQYILEDVYQGNALPMETHLSSSDYDYLTVYDQTRALGVSYDPERGREIIRSEMLKMGANLVDDVWQFNRAPVRLKFIIRVEDERRDIGDLIRVELEKAGFLVSSSYQQFASAVLSVYSTDPQAFEWHLYTEGWGRSSPQRYDFATVNSMAAPWMGNMPGWREIGFWQYDHEELDNLGKRLFTGDFQGVEERDEIYRQMVALSSGEAVRIGIASVMNSFSVNPGVRGITEDVIGGPRGPWTLREAYLEGANELKVGNLWVWTERTVWNPVGGFGDVYSNDIFQHLYDPPMWNHPFTGLPIPFRSSYQVETAGPDATLVVPEEAVIWNASDNRWVPVGPGIHSVSKVTFDYSRYFDANWHHGQPITMADVIYAIVQKHEITNDSDKSRIEFAIGATARPYLETIKAYRVVDDNKLDIYVDFWHFNEDQIASYASPTNLSTPWEILLAMDRLVFTDRRAAYSGTASTRFSVPWISLVMERDARLVSRTLEKLHAERSFSEEMESIFSIGGRQLATLSEARERYEASIGWFDQYKLLVVSNGPFMLARFDPAAQFAEIHANRDPQYPYRPGDWYFGSSANLLIDRVSFDELKQGHDTEITVSVTGPGTIGLHYALIDRENNTIVDSGEADSSSSGAFNILLLGDSTVGLDLGVYELGLVAYSDEIATLSERIIDLELIR